LLLRSSAAAFPARLDVPESEIGPSTSAPVRDKELAKPIVSTEFSIAPGHPALAGHFPGDPVVPGVVLLQYVLEALDGSVGRNASLTILNVKFLKPLRPEETCEVDVLAQPGDTYAFTCRAQGGVVARGALRLAFSRRD
jgi:3-hydroxymyristoyl/3-hydroxydecanoyl-(acyl carrier protein) dehydratase